MTAAQAVLGTALSDWWNGYSSYADRFRLLEAFSMCRPQAGSSLHQLAMGQTAGGVAGVPDSAFAIRKPLDYLEHENG
jgi:hypothetical protein